MNYTYMLQCADGTFYTGWTNDLPKRLKTHSAGKGGKYTRSRLPVKLVYAEEHEERTDAMRREVQIKRLSRQRKQELLHSAGNVAAAFLMNKL